MIHFRTVRWKNLLSTGNVFTEVALDRSPTTLIIGENGAGKSTFLEALSYGLYGRPFRQINKGQLVNSINQKNLVVEVEFSVGSIDYKVIRGIKPAIFEIRTGEVLLNQDASARDYQEHLERHLLRMNHKAFCQVVTLGAASFVPFMQLSASARREFVEELLDLRIFSGMAKQLKVKLDENREVGLVNKTTIELLDRNIVSHNRRKALAEEDRTALRRDYEQRIEDVQVELHSYETDIEKYETERSSLSYSSNEERDVRALKEKYIKYRAVGEGKLHQYRSSIEKNREDRCGECGQPLPEEERMLAIARAEADIVAIEAGLKAVDCTIEGADKRLLELLTAKTSIVDLDRKIGILTVKKENALARYKEYERTLNTTETSASYDVAELERLTNEKIALVRESQVIAEERDVMVSVAELLKDGGIKSRIIKQYVPLMNKLINRYLSDMGFFAMFEMDETFQERVKSRFRDEFSYDSFSEGEKLRIDLALLFTWRTIAKVRNSAATNLLIMDEIMDSSLDASGAEEFLHIVRQLAEDTNVFIISHRGDQLVDKFNDTIRFVKDGNFSRRAE